MSQERELKKQKERNRRCFLDGVTVYLYRHIETTMKMKKMKTSNTKKNTNNENERRKEKREKLKKLYKKKTIRVEVFFFMSMYDGSPVVHSERHHRHHHRHPRPHPRRHLHRHPLHRPHRMFFYSI